MRTGKKGWKTVALLLLSAALTACSGGKNNDGASESPTSSDSPKTTDGKTIVTMTVMTKDRFLTEAEQKFETAFPDIDIQIEEIVPADTSNGNKVTQRVGTDSGPKPEEIEKYMNSVNTAIMSGNASDIISVENLPVDKYAEKGLLTDWNELAGKDGSFNKSDYYENIFSGVSKGSGWFGIPASFSLDVMFGKSSLLKQNGLDDKTWTWDQFIDLLEKTKTGGKTMITPEKLLGFLVQSAYGRLIKQDGNSATFDTDTFQAYMENVKKLYDSGLATAEVMDPENTNFVYINLIHPMDIVLFQQGSGNLMTMLRPPGTGQDEGIPFKSNRVLGLNAKSKVKDAAWSFVKFLLSEEIQSSMFLESFPMNKAALKSNLVHMQKVLAGEVENEEIGMTGPDGVPVELSLTDKDIDNVLAIIPSVGKYSNNDPKVLSMITEESAAYFSDSKSADAVAKSLANRISTYLNE